MLRLISLTALVFLTVPALAGAPIPKPKPLNPAATACDAHPLLVKVPFYDVIYEIYEDPGPLGLAMARRYAASR